MVSVTAKIEGKSLIIEPVGKVAKFASLRRRMEIPLASIKSVSTVRVEKIKGTRIGGTSLPPRYYAGHFYDFTEEDRGRIFYTLSNRDKCVTLELDNIAYKRVIVQVQDKAQTAEPW